jgi:crotonobetainyl-CoA:carnitine CoA-transferase CaiB-like acyl-CoA transferase
MTHYAHELGRFGDPLTGRLACYRIYRCADGRFLTVAALEAKFFLRLCQLVGREDLAARQYEPAQEALAAELAGVFATKPLADWLALFDGDDVCAGPVATYAEAAATFGRATGGRAPDLGEHTDAWRSKLQA